MMMVMVLLYTARRLRQILHVGKLPVAGGAGEVRGELIQLSRGGGIACRLRRLRGRLQIRGDLLRDRPVLHRIRLLQLLQRTQDLRERRKLAAIGLRDG